MVEIGDNTFRQDYYSDNFWILTQVTEEEKIRLKFFGIEVFHDSMSVTVDGNSLIFYVHLYFKGNSGTELPYKDLFGNN